MKVVQEIFGPVGVLIKANDTLYGLAAAVFTQLDIDRASETARKLKAGIPGISCVNTLQPTCRSEISNKAKRKSTDPASD